MHYRPSIQQTPLKLPRQLFYQFSGKGDEIVEKYVKQLEVSVKRYHKSLLRNRSTQRQKKKISEI